MIKKNLYKSAGILIIISFAGKILGFLRDASIANSFGATYKTDAYTIAFIIPIMLFSIIGDSVTTAFIPLLSESYKNNQKEDMFSFVNSILNILIIISLLLCIIGTLFTTQIVSFVAPKFLGERYLLTIRLTRISVFSMVFMSMTACYVSLLQTMDNFTGPALVGISVSVPIILYTVTGSKSDIYGLVLFTLLGYGLQALIQVPWLIKNNYKYSLKINWKDYRLKRLLYIILPVIIGTGANEINVLIEKIMASGLPEGSITALDYGNKINTLIYTTFALAVITVVFPTLSREGSYKNYENFKQHLCSSINSINMIMIPSAIVMVIFRTTIVSVLFKRGAFDVNAVNMTSGVVLYLSLGIIFYGIRDICNKAFFALQDTKTPMIIGIIGVVVCILTNLVVVRYMGINGLALSSTVSVILCSLLLTIKIDRKIKNIKWNKIYKDTSKILLSSLIMGVTMYISNKYIIRAIPYYKGEVISLFCSLFIGIAVYILILKILKVKEIKDIKDLIKVKIGGNSMKHKEKYIFIGIGIFVVFLIFVFAISLGKINKNKSQVPSVSKSKLEAPIIKDISITKRGSNSFNVEVIVDGDEGKELLYQIWVQTNDGWSLIKEYGGSSSCTWTPTKGIREYLRIQAKIKDSKTGVSYYEKIQGIPYKELGILKINSLVTDSSLEGNGEIGKPIKITVNADEVNNTMYQYFVTKGNGLEKLSDYIEDRSFTWIPQTGGNFRIVVKTKNKTGYQFDEMSIPFQISGVSYKSPEIKDVLIEYSGKDKTLKIKGESVEKSKDEQYRFSIGESLRTPQIVQDYSSKDDCLWKVDKSGIYEIMTYLKNKDSLDYEDGMVKVYQVKTSKVKNVKIDSINLSQTNLTQPIGSTLKFTAIASGGNKLLYSFWCLESNGHRLIKDYSEDNNFIWIPENPGVYTILTRVKDMYSGSFEDEKSVSYNIVDSDSPNINLKNITVDGNLKKRTPITIKVEATCEKSIMYKFFIISDFLGCEKIKDFSLSNTCVWTPRKPGNYKIEVWVKTLNSDSYQARMIKEVNID